MAPLLSDTNTVQANVDDTRTGEAQLRLLADVGIPITVKGPVDAPVRPRRTSRTTTFAMVELVVGVAVKVNSAPFCDGTSGVVVPATNTTFKSEAAAVVGIPFISITRIVHVRTVPMRTDDDKPVQLMVVFLAALPNTWKL